MLLEARVGKIEALEASESGRDSLQLKFQPLCFLYNYLCLIISRSSLSTPDEIEVQPKDVVTLSAK